MHIRVYVKFHFHLHLQSYFSNWHIIYVVNYIWAILTYTISCLRASGPLARPLLTNPNPLHHPRVLLAQNGQCHIHARSERTRPLTGAGIEAARRPRKRRLRRFRVHAAAPRSKVAIAGYNMHVKSSWESMLQLAVLPQLVNLFQ